MPAVLGQTIVIVALIILVSACIKQIIGDIRGGGSCAGCSGGCSGCSKNCEGKPGDTCKIDADTARKILNKVEKPRSLK
ncbi:MAG: hypothetical protein K6G42_03895 [Lachnospiraceae bacterium]|nr:hypothetical protein [Lachnospiraceae bacterium]